ncbi:MAG: hypothetical protein HXX20_01615 [Chloroflexi bacterium]|nr:hypothetical protein [Chloroflexota bacterium]
MIELTNNIGDNRRCSVTAWKTDDWLALAVAQGLPQPSRIQDYMRSGKVIGQVYYYLIEELPRLVAWLETTGRAYRIKSFDEVTPPSPELVKNRAIRQQQQIKAAEDKSWRASKLTELPEEEKPPQSSNS